MNFFNVEGSGNGANASFGVAEFTISSFNPSNQTASGIQGDTFTLTLTESNAGFTAPGTLNFYFTTNNTIAIGSGGPLRYGNASGTSVDGIDAQLGTIDNGLYLLGNGAFNTTGNNGSTGTVDTYTFRFSTLSAAAQSALLTDLSTPSGVLRLVIAGATPATAATFAGYNNSTLAGPTLTLTPTFQASSGLYWQAGSSTWMPSGGTNWSLNPNGPGDRGWNNDGTANAFFAQTGGGTVTISGGNINANSLRFDVNNYAVTAAASGDLLTLTGGHFIQVTNAADTATVSAPIDGASGLIKLGTGTLVLGGANTYTTSTSIVVGTLQISADANLGAASAGVQLNGGTLAVNASTALGVGRALSGSGGALSVPVGQTLTVNGNVDMSGALSLPGAGTVALTSASGRGYENLSGLTFSGASTLSSVGVLNVGTITAGQTGGTAAISANTFINGTVNFNVVNAGATLVINGPITSGFVNANGFNSRTATLVKQGSGTLDLTGDNSALIGAGTIPGSVRQGVAGTSPAAGGTIIVHTSTGLGNGQYQLNNGTFINASGGPLVFPNGMSIGGGQVAGGATFSGAPSEFTGEVSLFNPAGAVYQHVITVTAPTTFSGGFVAATGTNSGLRITGGSSLTIASPSNTFTDNITVDPSTSLILTKEGALALNPFLTLQSSALLRLSTGVTSGSTDALNNNMFVTLNPNSHINLDIGSASETVGGLQLGAAVQVAGTYGPLGSGAAHETDYLTGSGFIINAGTATAPVPEPGTWLMSLLGGCGLLAWRRVRKASAPRGAGC